MENWDCKKRKYVKQSKRLKDFFNEIEEICKKYDYSISHEDGHGAFEIKKYTKDNIDWLKFANLNID